MYTLVTDDIYLQAIPYRDFQTFSHHFIDWFHIYKSEFQKN